MIFNCYPKPKPAPKNNRLQIIGAKSMRVSGIQMSRSAYSHPLKELFPDLIEVTYKEALNNVCDINLWAVRSMSLATLSEVKALPGFNIWCIVLESTALQPGVRETAEVMDQIWVPTTFVKEVCVNGGIPPEKIRIIPYYLEQPPRPRIVPDNSDPFTVLVSWDDASNMERKNVINSIRAFKAAWPTDSTVRLKLKTRDLRESNEILIRDAINNDERITLQNEFLEDGNELFDGAHVLFHVHRAEGYGRHTIEAMLRYLPVIATGYSGCMDWLTTENSFLVDYSLIPTDQELFQYPVNGLWAEPNFTGMVLQLLACRCSYSGEILDILSQAREDALKATSMKRVVNEMRKAFDYARIPTPTD